MGLRHFPGRFPAWVNIHQLVVFIVLIPEGKGKLFLYWSRIPDKNLISFTNMKGQGA